jgi:superfamily II DNA or RNA helicase
MSTGEVCVVELRDYQGLLTNDVRAAFRRVRRVLMVLPTGGGKTIIFVFIALSAAAKDKRIIIVAHRAEIIGQISRALDTLGVKHGRIQPGHSPTSDPVQCAMVQSLANRVDRLPDPDLIVIDETHHAVSPSYQIIFDRWPKARILGVTATPQRLDGRGLGRLFDEMVLGPTSSELIRDGWLAKYDYLAPPSKVDLSKVHTRAGDYAPDELAEQVDQSVITGDALDHWREFVAPRSAIAFCVTVGHAEHVAKQFTEAGVRAASVDGSMDKQTRRDRIEGIGNGRYDILTSCALISEGLDVPSVGGIILLRPTKSLSLHLQQIGRGLRPKDDKSDCKIMDHVGNVYRHGLPDAPRNWTLDDKKHRADAAPIAQCEVCFRVFATGPAWRMSQECGEGMPAGCALVPEVAESGGGVAEPPEQVDGKLVRVTTTPGWAKGCDIVLARGAEWNTLVHHADTFAKLDEIRRLRNLQPGWPYYVMKGRRNARRAT